MTTEDTTASTSEAANLDSWRKCPYLTVDEAMNLISGVKPGTYRFDYGKESQMPPEAVPIYRALINDIRDFKLCVCFNGIEATDETVLNQLNVVSYDEYLHSCWWHQGNLLAEDLKKWLRGKGFPSAFFEIKPANTPDYLNKDLEEHSYKLAAAVEAWEHFYTHGLTNPKKSLKDNIEAWLTENANRLNLLYNKKISKTAIEEVAKIVNWKPEGGAPKS
jgi:hypothetical protein